MEIKTKFEIGEEVLVENYDMDIRETVLTQAKVLECLITLKPNKVTVSYRVLVQEKGWQSTRLKVESKIFKNPFSNSQEISETDYLDKIAHYRNEEQN